MDWHEMLIWYGQAEETFRAEINLRIKLAGGEVNF